MKLIIVICATLIGQYSGQFNPFITTLPPESTTDFFAYWTTTTMKPFLTAKVGDVHLFNMTPITGRGKPYDFSDLQKPSMYKSKPVHVKEYPFSVSILRDGDVVGFGCLMSELWVLTTAYNAMYGPRCILRVSVGSNSPYLFAQTAFVKKREIYPLYNYTWQHNVGMLRLDRPIIHSRLKQFTRVGTYLPHPHARLTLLGWGTNGLHSQVLLEKMDITYMPTSLCQSYFYDAEDLMGHVFCIPDTRQGPCRYNFGAPLLDPTGDIIGIYLGTHKCNSNESYGAYIDVTYYKDWIENTAYLPDDVMPDGGDYRVDYKSVHLPSAETSEPSDAG